MNKDELIAAIEQRLRWIPNQPGLCLYYARETVAVLRHNGIKAVLQAGSMQWPIVKPEDDDGVSNTHFAYMWEPDHPLSILATKFGALPEIHVWVGLPETQEVVDFSTRYFKEAAEERGLKWRTEDPPQYLWAHELPNWVRYVPNRDATIFAMKLLIESFVKGQR